MATSNKAYPIILIGVAALGILAYFGMNHPPGDEVTGTVAPAERYRADQTDEIQLGDESIQAVLQSDVFERLVNDEAFQAASQSEQARAMMLSFAASEAFGSEQVIGALNSEELYQGLAEDRMFSELFLSAEMWGALNSEAARAFLADQDLRAFAASDSFDKAFSVSELSFAFRDERFGTTLNSEAFKARMDAQFKGGVTAEALNAVFDQQLFGNIEALTALRMRFGDEQLQSAFENIAFREGLTSALFLKAMSEQAFFQMVSRQNLRYGFQSPSFEKIFGSQQLRNRITSAEMIRAFSDANIRDKFANDQFLELAFLSPAFKDAFLSSERNFAEAWRSSEALRFAALEQARAIGRDIER